MTRNSRTTSMATRCDASHRRVGPGLVSRTRNVGSQASRTTDRTATSLADPGQSNDIKGAVLPREFRACCISVLGRSCKNRTAQAVNGERQCGTCTACYDDWLKNEVHGHEVDRG